MPLTHFTHPKFPSPITLADAPMTFEEAGICPAEVLQSLINDISDERRGAHTGISPSMFDPSSTCKRKVLIERFCSYGLNPLKLWLATSGKVWHSAFLAAKPDGWISEGYLPDFSHAQHSKVRLSGQDFYEYEMWPGVWVSGRVDRYNNQRIIDFKTQRYARQDYGPKAGWDLQLNAYRFMLEDLTGTHVERLDVWRIYEGSWEEDRTFKRYHISLLTRETFDSLCQPHCESLADWLRRAHACYEIKDKPDQPSPPLLRDVIAACPMDGEVKKLFGGKMCPQYCNVRDLCYGFAGRDVAF